MSQIISFDDKRVFLIASCSSERAEFYSSVINRHYPGSTVFISSDGVDALFKADNYPPNILITDTVLNRKTGLEVATTILRSEKFRRTAIIIASDLPNDQNLIDEVVTGQVQFLLNYNNESMLNISLAKALNFSHQGDTQQYHLHYLTPSEVLFRQGDIAKSVFIVKRGSLEASKGEGDQRTLLGQIQVGEFVGEMAHINGEPRSATVTATTDCELIEIPMGTLDLVLFAKPAWSKALISTLSRRLKLSNNARSPDSTNS